MNNKLVVAAIGTALIAGFLVLVLGAKGDKKEMLANELKSMRQLITQGELDKAKEFIDGAAEKKPDSDFLGKAYYELAQAYENKEYFSAARDLYQLILKKYQNIDNVLSVQERIGDLNLRIIFSPAITDKDVSYLVLPGDSLSKIAKEFGTTIDLIKTANSLSSNVIRSGSKLKVNKDKYNILIDKSQNLLTLLSKDGTIVKVYQVSTGKDNCTPVGTFTIVNKIKDPVWYTEGAIVPAESPDNILGSRWLGFSIKGYGIHGTVEPESIGKQATQGCIRMVNKEVEELFTIVPAGAEVAISD